MPLEIEENLTETLETALKSGRIDAAIVALPFAPPGIVTEFLYEEPFRIVVPRGHKWARRKSVHVDELASENPILLGVGHCFRDQVLDACPELNRADSRVTRGNSLETVRNMVASGLGVSVLPRDAMTPKYHSTLVVPVPFARPIPARRVALAWRKSFPRLQAIAWDEAAIRFQIAHLDLIVNATPLGLNRSDPSPIPARLLAPHLMVYDTVYGEGRTSFVAAAIEAGSRAANSSSLASDPRSLEDASTIASRCRARGSAPPLPRLEAQPRAVARPSAASQATSDESR